MADGQVQHLISEEQVRAEPAGAVRAGAGAGDPAASWSPFLLFNPAWHGSTDHGLLTLPARCDEKTLTTRARPAQCRWAAFRTSALPPTCQRQPATCQGPCHCAAIRRAGPTYFHPVGLPPLGPVTTRSGAGVARTRMQLYTHAPACDRLESPCLVSSATICAALKGALCPC